MRDSERLAPVVDPKSGGRVPGLYVRAGSLVMCRQMMGRRLLRRVSTLRRLQPGEQVSRAMIVEATKFMHAQEQLARAGRWDIMNQTKERREVSTVADLIREYRVAASRLGRPAPDTVARNVASLLLVLRRGLGVDAVEGKALTVLDGQLVKRFADALLAGVAPEGQDSRRRSIVSYLNQARSILAPRMVQEFGGLKLPDLKPFMERAGVVAPPVKKRPFTVAEVEVIRSGARLEHERPDLWPVWFLAYYCALRAGEIAQVRRDWIRKHEVTAQQAQGAAWLNGRGWCWVLDLGADPAARLKNAASAAAIPLADDVAERLLAIGADREWLVPGGTETERRDVVNRDFPKWMREQGWTMDGEYAQAVRRYRSEVWAAVHDGYCAERWLRHSHGGVRSYYDSGLFLARRPLGLAE